MNEKTKQILLTNDDSIHSPGLWAAAEALDPLGFVHVVAPIQQQTGTGHSMPNHTSGVIEEKTLHVNGRDWTVYAVDGSPGQAVVHGVFDVMGVKPDLVVSGINYGENIGAAITVSGTVGAALEAASMGIPALAVSLQTEQAHHLSLAQEVDFNAAGYFTNKFARAMLNKHMPFDVDVLKVDIPCCASPDTPWVLTRQSREQYYFPTVPQRESFSEHGPVSYQLHFDPAKLETDGDIYVLLAEKKVSVTPLSIDMTSRTDLSALRAVLEGQEHSQDEK